MRVSLSVALAGSGTAPTATAIQEAGKATAGRKSESVKVSG